MQSTSRWLPILLLTGLASLALTPASAAAPRAGAAQAETTPHSTILSLEVLEGGGYPPPGVPQRYTHTLALYRDGTILVQGSTDGRGMSTYRIGKLSKRQQASRLAALTKASSFTNWGHGIVADATTTHVLTYGKKPAAVSVYSLSSYRDPGLTPAQVQARRGLTRALASMSGGVALREWVPQEYEVRLGMPVAAGPDRPWLHGALGDCGRITRTQLLTLGSTFTQGSTWTGAGGRASVWIYPLMPGTGPCRPTPVAR